MTVQPKASAETGADLKSRHRPIENRGALPKDHELGEKKKRERTKFFLQERSLPLDLPANGRPLAGLSLSPFIHPFKPLASLLPGFLLDSTDEPQYVRVLLFPND